MPSAKNDRAKGLGKGLGALLGDEALSAQDSGSALLPLSQVQPGLNQPRKRFDEESLQDLADSIRLHGVIQPLTVRRLASGYYQIIAGERRWRAARLAGLSEIPAIVIEADDRKVMELGLIENLQREGLNPIEEAGGYRVLIDEYGLTQEEVAERVGKSRSAVANALRLTALPESVRTMVEEGSLSAGHARAVLSAPAAAREAMAKRILEGDLSVRQAEALARKLSRAQTDSPRKADEDPIRIYRDAAAQELAGRLGRRVSIQSGTRKGKLEIEFYGDDDLTELLDVLSALPGKH